MDRYVAFLRGMNIGGRRIKNEQLRSEFEQLGFEEVATFRASGNVIFATSQGSEATLARKIESGLAEALGYEVTVFLRSASELRAIAAAEPFATATVEASKGKLQVSLLARKPTPAVRRKVLAMATDDDLLAIQGRELYWLPSGGILESGLDLQAIEAAVGVDTRRTMGTIEQIASKYCG